MATEGKWEDNIFSVLWCIENSYVGCKSGSQAVIKLIIQ